MNTMYASGDGLASAAPGEHRPSIRWSTRGPTITPRHEHILVDPATFGTWAAFQGFVRDGIRMLHQWGPRDGMDFPAPQPSHQHSVPTLIACLAGSIPVVGRNRIDLMPGDLLLVEPGCWHHQPVLPTGAISFGMGFIADWCDVTFLDDREKLWGRIQLEPYRSLVDGLMAESDQSKRLQCVDQILGGIANQRIAHIDWIHPAVPSMAEYLWRHLHLRLDVDAMVASSSLGRTTGFRLFKEFFGRPPKQEIIAQRLALAAHLYSRGYTPAEVARRSGFTSCTDLSRSFRTHAGSCPPSPRDAIDKQEVPVIVSCEMD
jgi:AraC-like DNA-binding protein